MNERDGSTGSGGREHPTRVDVLAYATEDDGTVHRFIDAGRGSQVVAAHETEYRKRTALQYAAVFLLTPFVYASLLLSIPVPLPDVPAPLVVSSVGLSLLTYAVVVAGGVLPPHTPTDDSPFVPALVEQNLPRERAARLFPGHE